jgi:SEC-C motif domain protein
MARGRECPAVLLSRLMRCACHSGRDYADCCQPFHQGEPAPTCEQLMRSRYGAFALGLSGYLQHTLAFTHPDRGEPLVLPRRTYSGLTIVEAHKDEVLFVARIEERGRDLSFAELSKFVKERGEWRYASGRSLPADRLPLVLTRKTFLDSL